MKLLNGAGYNRHTVLTTLGIFITNFLVFLGTVYLANVVTLYEVSWISFWWTAAWFNGTVFAFLNTRDSWCDFRRYNRSSSHLRSGQIASEWFLREDAISLVACLMMALAGYAAILRFDTDIVVSLLFISGVLRSLSQMLNRMDRLRTQRILKEEQDAARRKAV